MRVEGPMVKGAARTAPAGRGSVVGAGGFINTGEPAAWTRTYVTL